MKTRHAGLFNCMLVAIFCLVVAASCTDASKTGPAPYIAWEWGDLELGGFLLLVFGGMAVCWHVATSSLRVSQHTVDQMRARQLAQSQPAPVADAIANLVSHHGLSVDEAAAIVEQQLMLAVKVRRETQRPEPATSETINLAHLAGAQHVVDWSTGASANMLIDDQELTP